MPNDYEKFKTQNEVAENVENKETSSENKENNEIGPEQAVEIVQQQVVETINIGETTLNTTMKKLEANPEEISEASTELSAINEEIAELGENVTEEIVEPQENSTEKYSIRPDESPEHYLCRLIGKNAKKFSPIKSMLEPNPLHIITRFFANKTKEERNLILENIIKNSDVSEKFNEEENLKTIKEASLGGFDSPIKERNADEFEKTNQERNFFGIRGKSNDSKSYSTSLFALPFTPENHPLIKDYYKKILDNKNIILLGGGDSAVDLLKDPETKPKQVINIDPFLKKETFDKNPQGNYYNLDKKADDPTLSDYFKEQGIKADEIWASYSVPLYLKNHEEVANLFNNIKNILAENGKCRITPMSIDKGNQDNIDIKSILKDLIKDKEFNIKLLGNTLTITRVKKE